MAAPGASQGEKHPRGRFRLGSLQQPLRRAYQEADGVSRQKLKSCTSSRCMQKTGNAVAPLHTGTGSAPWRVSAGSLCEPVAQVTARRSTAKRSPKRSTPSPDLSERALQSMIGLGLCRCPQVEEHFGLSTPEPPDPARRAPVKVAAKVQVFGPPSIRSGPQRARHRVLPTRIPPTERPRRARRAAQGERPATWSAPVTVPGIVAVSEGRPIACGETPRPADSVRRGSVQPEAVKLPPPVYVPRMLGGISYASRTLAWGASVVSHHLHCWGAVPPVGVAVRVMGVLIGRGEPGVALTVTVMVMD
jgi:hypothetical protein